MKVQRSCHCVQTLLRSRPVTELEALGAQEGELVALEGGITNRNFRGRFGGRDYVVRYAGVDTELLGIDRDAERIANAAAAEIGIAPEVALGFEGGLVTRFVVARPVAEAEVRERAGELGGMLRAFHDCGVALDTTFDVPALARAYREIVVARGGRVPAEHDAAIALADRVVARLGPGQRRPCHNDLLTANLLAEGDRLLLIDWEYAGMGDPFFDLGNLAAHHDFGPAEGDALLAGWLGCEPDAAARERLAGTRVLSDVREATWGVVQGALSDLDFDFAGYAARYFARLPDA